MLYGLCCVVYCLLFVGWLSMIGWLLCVASCGSSCWLVMVNCLFVVYLLFDVLAYVACCSLCVVCCSLCVVCFCDLRCWLLVVSRLLIVGGWLRRRLGLLVG